MDFAQKEIRLRNELVDNFSKQQEESHDRADKRYKKMESYYKAKVSETSHQATLLISN